MGKQIQSGSGLATAEPDQLTAVRERVQAARMFFTGRLRFPLVVFAVSFALFLVVRTYTRGNGLLPLLRWDAGWYGNIIDYGYSTDGNVSVQHNVVFLPLYPLTCAILKRMLPIATPDAMLLVSAGSTMIMLALIYNLLTPLYSGFVARMTVLLVALGPFSLFLYNGYTESLFLCLLALFFFLLVRRRYIASGVVIGFASACRPHAPLLILVLLFEVFRQYYAENRLRVDLKSPLLRQLFVAIPLCFTGVAAYTMWSYYRFDDPLAFVHGYAAWSSHGSAPAGLADIFGFYYILDGLGKHALASGLFAPLVVGLLLFASAPLLFIGVRKELFPSATALIVLMFAFYHFTVLKDRLEVTNLGRHFSLLFPYALLLALALEPGRVRRFLLRMGGAEHYERSSCGCVHVMALIPSLLILVTFVLLNVQYVVMFYRGLYIS